MTASGAAGDAGAAAAGCAVALVGAAKNPHVASNPTHASLRKNIAVPEDGDDAPWRARTTALHVARGETPTRPKRPSGPPEAVSLVSAKNPMSGWLLKLAILLLALAAFKDVSDPELWRHLFEFRGFTGSAGSIEVP